MRRHERVDDRLPGLSPNAKSLAAVENSATLSTAEASIKPILVLEDLVIEFGLPRSNPFAKPRRMKVVDGVSLTIFPGEVFGLVGESGSGKTTLGRAILGLIEPTAGRIVFAGSALPKAGSGAFRHLRRHLQMIFQDPYSSLNPYMTVGGIIAEGLTIHHLYSDPASRSRRVDELMREVGLDPATANRHPHEFSGGQRQRIGIARALAVEPSFIVADEPVSALDVSIQAQIINLLIGLQLRRQLTYLFIAHDLAVVRQVCDRVAVMYLGKLMELADRDALYGRPLHPYTQALLSAVPIPDPVAEEGRHRVILQGDIPSPSSPPSGCVFHTRCPLAMETCRRVVPEWRKVESGSTEHWVACHLV
jgi:oligopeptide transport system ATP-binding protein